MKTDIQSSAQRHEIRRSWSDQETAIRRRIAAAKLLELQQLVEFSELSRLFDHLQQQLDNELLLPDVAAA